MLAHPLDEWFAIIAIHLAGAFGSLAVRCAGFLSTFGSISGDAAVIAPARRCAALQFIADGRRGTADILSDTAQGHPYVEPESSLVQRA